MCESRGGRPGLPVPNSPYGLCGRKATQIELERLSSELRACVKVEVAVLGFPSLVIISLVVSVAVKQHRTRTRTRRHLQAKAERTLTTDSTSMSRKLNTVATLPYRCDKAEQTAPPGQSHPSARTARSFDR